MLNYDLEIEGLTMLILGNSAVGLRVTVKDRPDYVNLKQATVDDGNKVSYGFWSSESVAIVQALLRWKESKAVELTGRSGNDSGAIDEDINSLRKMKEWKERNEVAPPLPQETRAKK